MKSTLDELAIKIDRASDEHNMDIANESLSEINSLLTKALSSSDKASLYYFAANCHSIKKVISGEVYNWSWENENIEKEIYFFKIIIS